MKERFIPAGKIVATHGVRGEVKIETWTDTPEFLGRVKTLYADGKPVRVTSSRVHKNMLIAKLEGVDDINAAMLYKDREIAIDRADAPLPPGGYFIQDIIGAHVVTETGDTVGTLAEAFDAPAGMVYVVRGEKEHLIPAVPEFVLKTDADAGVITVRLIEGM